MASQVRNRFARRAGAALGKFAVEWLFLHWRGGLGRAGIVAARLLIEFGEAPEIALFRVRHARRRTVENRLQEEYLRGLLEAQGMF